eukprot:PhM_4_TR4945/c0_g1_i1/m.35586
MDLLRLMQLSTVKISPGKYSFCVPPAAGFRQRAVYLVHVLNRFSSFSYGQSREYRLRKASIGVIDKRAFGGRDLWCSCIAILSASPMNISSWKGLCGRRTYMSRFVRQSTKKKPSSGSALARRASSASSRLRRVWNSIVERFMSIRMTLLQWRALACTSTSLRCPSRTHMAMKSCRLFAVPLSIVSALSQWASASISSTRRRCMYRPRPKHNARRRRLNRSTALMSLRTGMSLSKRINEIKVSVLSFHSLYTTGVDLTYTKMCIFLQYMCQFFWTRGMSTWRLVCSACSCCSDAIFELAKASARSDRETPAGGGDAAPSLLFADATALVNVATTDKRAIIFLRRSALAELAASTMPPLGAAI